jgi:hypothetical protein
MLKREEIMRVRANVLRLVTATSVLVGLMAIEAGAVFAQLSTSKSDQPILSVGVTVDLGEDRGQNFGSLFEMKDAAGRVVAGAGFPAVYNTRFRMDRQTIQFFVRPPARQEEFTFERLPRPDDHCGLYMFDYAGRLFAINESAGGPFSEWNPDASSWRPATGEVEGLKTSYDGVVRLGSGILRFDDGAVTYEGRTVLPAATVGRYANFYYAQGRLFFYHTVRSETDGSTRICACRWTPESPAPIDVEQADAIRVEPVGATTWAYGHLGEQVLTVSNHGGVFVHDGTGWKVLRERVPNVSYQVYSVVTYYDRLLLGHYPTGEVFEFDGQNLTRKEGFPPKLPTVSSSARECQTLAIYGGELFAGVWPWGEVWRHDRAADRWESLGRLFTHPEAHNRTVHPYEEDAVRHGLVANQWGQRVTSAVTIGPSLMFSTSAKSNALWESKFEDFLSDSERKEYGAVLRLTIPGNVSAPIAWKSEPINLQFIVSGDRMTVMEDGSEVGSAAFEPTFLKEFKPETVAWGQGMYGDLIGSITKQATSGIVRQADRK